MSIDPSGPFALNLKKAIRKVYPEEEMLFLEWATETLQADAKRREQLGSPIVQRLMELRFTYPTEQFPTDKPDGVWSVETSNIVVPDPRFRRDAIGVEKRGTKERTVIQVAVLARHRSDEIRTVIGELLATGEIIHDTEGKVEYRLVQTRLVGDYDASAKRWNLVSRSIGRVPGGPDP